MIDMKKILVVAALFVMALGGSARAQIWNTYTVKNSEIGGDWILALATDSKNNKWVGTTLGLCKLSGKTWSDYAMFNEKLKNQFVNCLTVDQQGTLWIGTDDYGVIEFNGTRWTEHDKQTRQLNMQYISEIAIDRNNVKWIGVTLGGLVRYDGTDWKKFNHDNSDLLSDFILCVTIDKKNQKWIGTNEGLSVFDGKNWTSYTTRNCGMPDNIVSDIAIDRNDVKWIGTLGGLCRFDGQNWLIYNRTNSPLPSNQINALVFDNNGLLWIATDKGVAVFDGAKNWKVFTPQNSPISSGVIRDIAIDNQGVKWFGTDMQGLVRYAGHGVMGRISDDKGNPKAGVKVQCGNTTVATDENGVYYCDVETGSSLVVKPLCEGRTVEPQQITLANVSNFAFNQDFTVSSGLVAGGSSTEKVMVNPYLEQGYITITMESPQAEVEFVNSKGVSVRTIPQYQNNAKITISKMPKDNYTLYIRTAKGEKSLQFNLK